MHVNELTHTYTPQSDRESAYLILHGVSEGIESDFIQRIYSGLAERGETVLAINWPYFDAGNKPSEDLIDEQSALQSAVEFLLTEGYKQILIVAKSLGGIVVSRWLEKHDDHNVKVGILGYVIGDVFTDSLHEKLQVVIQGERDRFGNAEAVRAELASHNITTNVIEIADADHSYRDQRGEPIYQQQAIEQLLLHI